MKWPQVGDFGWPSGAANHDLSRPLTNDRETLLAAIEEMEAKLSKDVAGDLEISKYTAQMRRRILRELRVEVWRMRSSHFPMPITRLSWQLLPPGEMGLKAIRSYYEKGSGTSGPRRFEFARIEQILTLSPSLIYLGTEQFDGYIVFAFSGIPFVVLDNPVFGNAVYLLKGDWKTLSTYSKMELLTEHAESVERILHTEAWFDRLRGRLGYL